MTSPPAGRRTAPASPSCAAVTSGRSPSTAPGRAASPRRATSAPRWRGSRCADGVLSRRMNPVSQIAGLRAAVGAGGYLAPNLTGRLFGLDPDGNPQAAFLARLFAVRDLALAAGTFNSDGDARRQWLALGMACDLGDALAAYLAGRDGTLPRPAAIMAGATALSGAALGVAALRRPT